MWTVFILLRLGVLPEKEGASIESLFVTLCVATGSLIIMWLPYGWWLRTMPWQPNLDMKLWSKRWFSKMMEIFEGKKNAWKMERECIRQWTRKEDVMD
jgi:hypothetical protein